MFAPIAAETGDVDSRVGSTPEGAVIAWFSCRTVEGRQDDPAMAALLGHATPHQRGLPTTALLDSTGLGSWDDIDEPVAALLGRRLNGRAVIDLS